MNFQIAFYWPNQKITRFRNVFNSGLITVIFNKDTNISSNKSRFVSQLKEFAVLLILIAASMANPSIAYSENESRTPQKSNLRLLTEKLEFGIVSLGEIASQKVELLHDGSTGSDPIEILSTSMDEQESSYFTTDIYTPVTLYPGERFSFDVFFSAASEQLSTLTNPIIGHLFISHTGEGTVTTVNMEVVIEQQHTAVLSRATESSTVGFGKSTLAGTKSSRPTSLQFGPDNRLYVADMLGTINIYTIERVGPNDYKVTDTETLQQIRDIPNHDDDGTINTSINSRLVTGILVKGTATNPIIYVASSDPRIGGGPQHTDSNLDTNSTIVSRLTWNGSQWQKLDLVRGLPRSEENHTGNGLAISDDGKYLYLAFGGNTNAGAISNNFALLPEYALSAAILEINLTSIANTTYDLPTLDDEDRPGSIDFNDPFGGNQGKNQAKLLDNAPVKIYAPGFRNPYDLVITESGRMYSIDNGPNAGWGGIPVAEGPAGNCLNDLNEPGQTFYDGLHYITGRGYYAGHANPTRGNSNNTFNASNPQSPVETANPIECDYKSPGIQNGSLVTFQVSTNGLTEYRASNFDNQMQGDLLAAGWNNKIFRIKLNQAGTEIIDSTDLFSNVATRPLDITAQSDQEIFPGSLWVTEFAEGKIIIFEANDYGESSSITCSADIPTADDDKDGFINSDELASGTDPCSSADIPSDFDGDFLSDGQDTDDDNDGIADVDDPFALDNANGANTSIPLLYDWENNSEGPGGIFYLGFTGLMSNGLNDYSALYNPYQMTASGAAGVLTIDNITGGDAYQGNNSQEYGFQLGINVSPSSPVFTVHTRLRINVGGPTIPSVGGDWLSDSSMSQYVNTGTIYSKNTNINLSKLSHAVPASLFTSSRWDAGAQPEMKWTLPVSPGQYEVRLYFAEIWSGAFAKGKRIFSANIEGTQLHDIDVFAEAGKNTALMHSAIVTSDSNLEISFQHIIQNPSLKGIEILPVVTTGNQPPSVNAGPDMILSEGSNANLVAIVSDDGLPTGNLDLQWSKVSGPGTVNFSLPTKSSSTASFSIPGVYTLKISANDGEFVRSDQLVVTINADPAPDPDVTEQLLMRFNVGGPHISDSSGDWLSDTEASQYVNTGNKYLKKIAINRSAIADSVPEAIFQSERWDAGSQPEMQWSIPVVPGKYRVNLYFAEIWSEAYQSGKRVFSVQVEDAVLKNIDIFDRAGKNTAVKESMVVTADSLLTIKFLHIVENPAIKGIEIIAIDGEGPGGGDAGGDTGQTQNKKPSVNVGGDKSVFVNKSISISAQVSDDGLPSDALTSNWSKISGPGLAQFSDSSKTTTNVSFSKIGLYKLRLTVTDGDLSHFDELLVTVKENVNTDTTNAIRINVGGQAINDSNGNWQSDASTSHYVNTGNSYSKNVVIDRSSLTSSVPQAIFNSERWDPASNPEMKWTIPVVPGNYEVRLYFAEIWSGAFAKGERVFSVNVEGVQLGNIDVFDEVGKNAALEYSVVVNADTDIDIQFQHVIENPSVKGIAIIPLDEDGGGTQPPPGDNVSATTNWKAVISNNGSKPVARHEAGAVEVNGKLYLLGGRGMRPVNKYDPVTNTWTSLGNAPKIMHHFQPVAIGSKIYVIGALACCYPKEESIKNIYIFNTQNGKWTTGPAIPANRVRGSAGTVVRNGKIYLLGGNTNGHSGGAVASFDEYDPSTNQWKSLPNAPHARDHFSAVLVGDKLVAAGGRKSSQNPNVFANTVAAVDIYNFNTGKWSTSAKPILTARAGTMAVNVGNEVIIMGGESISQISAHKEVEAYNVDTNVWRKLKPLINARHSGGAALLADGIHVVSGNKVRGGGNEITSHEKLNVK